MQINNSYTNLTKPSFGTLKYAQNAESFLKNLSREDIKSLKKIQDKLEFCKYWDMEIDSEGAKLVSNVSKKAYRIPPFEIKPPDGNTLKIKVTTPHRMTGIYDIKLKYSP